MEPRFETTEAKLLVGLGATMSLAADTTPQLWRAFMPRRQAIANRASTDFLCVRIYREPAERMFLPESDYEKWAAVEVTDHQVVPDGMERLVLEGGRYAVFVHHGPASAAADTMRFIYGEWIAGSDCCLDDRAHFELLPEDYAPFDPNAREEVWIPIKDRR